jgi:hypothetical protein
MSNDDFYVVLFQSVSQAMKAEKILIRAEIALKLIPVPKHISSDCGVCLRFFAVNEERVKQELEKSSVPYSKIRPLYDD